MKKPRPKILLVGWDGADWRTIQPLLAEGKLPNLQRIMQNGASGNLASLPPFLSPMLWNSIATGKRAEKHGILGFTELDETGEAARPVTSLSRKARPIWDILSCEGWRCHVVDWFASFPAEPINGYNISESFFRSDNGKEFKWHSPHNAVYPPEQQADFEPMRPMPNEIDRNILRLLIPKIDDFDDGKNQKMGELAYRLSELYSVHNCTMSIMDEEEWEFIGVYYHFIDWMGHDFMPYHPPKRPQVSQKDFDQYSEVVSGAYRLQDYLLGEAMAKAGPDANVLVLSDHGFQSDHLRPERTPGITAGIANWHRPYGMFAMAGPEVARGTTLPAATLLDITPTLLHLAGLPVGEDMDGRVIPDLVRSEAPVTYCPTWEGTSYAEQAGLKQPDLTADDASALIEQFELLGYITKGVSKQADQLFDMTRREMAFNLGISLLDAGSYAEALPHLETAQHSMPEQANLAFHLSRCLYELGLEEESNLYLRVLEDYGDMHPRANFIMGQIYAHRGRHEDALNSYAKALEADPDMPGLARGEGLAALAHGDAERALKAFTKAVEQDEDDPVSWIGLARTQLRLRNADAALEAVSHCLKLQPENAPAMVAQGAALAIQGNLSEATKSLQAALAIYPEAPVAHQILASIKEKVHGPGSEEYWNHWQEAERLMASGIEAADPEFINQLRAEHHKRKQEASEERQAKRAGQSPLDELELFGPQPGSSGKTFTLVSGLPRSGTSLLMQMLEAGGARLQTDGKRSADAHNPKGYLEWEPARDLPQNPKLIEAIEDRIAKVVSLLLRSLPKEHKYRVLFVKRDAHEVAASQAKMRADADSNGKALSAEKLAEHQEQILKMAEAAPHVELLLIEHRTMIDDPASLVKPLVNFLGADQLPNPEAMISVVDPKLYRQRKEES